MEKNKSLLYYDVKQYFSILFITSFFIFSIRVLGSYNQNLINMIYDIMIIISASVAIIIVSNVSNIINKNILYSINIIYTMFILRSSLLLIPNRSIINDILNRELYGYHKHAYILLFLLMIFLICNFCKIKKYRKLVIADVIFTAISIFYFINEFSVRSCFIVNFITTVSIFVLILSMKEVKLIVNKNINLIKQGSICILFICIIRFSMDFKFSCELFLCVYLSSTICLIDNMVRNPYKILFRGLVDKNHEMEELNYIITAKNKELEVSKGIVMGKEKMLKTFFRNIPMPLIMIDKNTERISFSNFAFSEVLGGKPLRKIINKKFINIINIDYKLSGDKEYSYIYRGWIEVNCDKKYFDIEFIDEGLDGDEIIMVFNDVTSKVKVDNMKKSIKNKVLEENLKRDFLSNISHDLKTPINVIYSAIQLEEFFVESNNIEGLKKYNNICRQNCITLTKLANNLIDSSRINSDYLLANLKVYNIVELLEDTVTKLVDYAISKNIELIFDTNEEEVYVKLDEDFMQRIMINLISNAIKFSRDNGVIQVIVEDLGDDVNVFIIDNGVGMDEEFVRKAFERYAMGKNNETAKLKGSGIGLFVVKRLVEIQNGSISLESEVGKGTVFKLNFDKIARGVKNCGEGA